MVGLPHCITAAGSVRGLCIGCVHCGAACDHLAVAQPSGKIEAEGLRCRVQQLFNQKARNAVPTERRKGAQQTSLPAVTGLPAQLTVVFTRSLLTSVVGACSAWHWAILLHASTPPAAGSPGAHLMEHPVLQLGK
jgi:hypothetical protein